MLSNFKRLPQSVGPPNSSYPLFSCKRKMIYYIIIMDIHHTNLLLKITWNSKKLPMGIQNINSYTYFVNYIYDYTDTSNYL